MSRFFPLLGLGFAVAGADKLLGQSGYRRMFRDWGWSRDDMRLVGAAELAGAVMVATPSTRRLGGAVLAATSGTMLSAELNRREGGLALPRLALFGCALVAVLRGG
jgi:uncharacterized membrane protein YphA (DoxX/SURF4 family)